MSIKFDPRLQGKQNTTDVFTGQQDVSQDAQGADTAPQTTDPSAQAPLPQQQAPQSNLATKKPSTGSSGMYTNLKQYAQKNQPASQNMAKSIGDTVQRSADIARKNIQNSRQQFGNLMEQGSLQNRGTAVSDVQSAATAASTMTAPQEGATADTTQGDTRLKSILDAAYKGPQQLRELGSFGETQRRAQEAGRLTKQLSGGNRQELLNKALERKGSKYTQGSRKLDELLFGQGKPQSYLEDRQKQIGDTVQDLTSASGTSREEAINRMRLTSDIKSQAREALQGTAGQRSTDVDDYLTGQIGVGGDLAEHYRNILEQGTSFNDAGQQVDSEGRLIKSAYQAAQTTDSQRNLGKLQALLAEKSKPVDTSLSSNPLASSNRQKEIADIQSKIKAAEGQIASEKAGQVVQKGLDLGTLEAGTLGVESGTGLYNLLRNKDERSSLLNTLDRRDDLDKSKMVTKDQQAQLAELQRIAQLSGDYGVADKGIDFRSDYQDAGKAGTQTALDALDTEGFRKGLTGAEERFREKAGQNQTGYGRARASYKKSFGRKGYKYSDAYETGNLKDILSSQGYDFKSDPSQYTNTTDPNLLSNLSDFAKTSKSETMDDSPVDPLEYLGGASSEALLDKIGLGGLAPGNIMTGVGDTIGSFGKTIGDDLIGGTMGNLISQGLGGVGDIIGGGANVLFGGGGGAAQSDAQRQARNIALEQLQNKLSGSLDKSGFTERVRVADTDESQARTNELMKILGNVNTQG